MDSDNALHLNQQESVATLKTKPSACGLALPSSLTFSIALSQKASETHAPARPSISHSI
jgi:hypothetical protein